MCVIVEKVLIMIFLEENYDNIFCVFSVIDVLLSPVLYIGCSWAQINEVLDTYITIKKDELIFQGFNVQPFKPFTVSFSNFCRDKLFPIDFPTVFFRDFPANYSIFFISCIIYNISNQTYTLILKSIILFTFKKWLLLHFPKRFVQRSHMNASEPFSTTQTIFLETDWIFLQSKERYSNFFTP